MKVMIQEVPTRRYYRSTGVWTNDVAQASDFRTSTAALAAISKSKLRNVQLVATRNLKDFEVFPLRQTLVAQPG